MRASLWSRVVPALVLTVGGSMSAPADALSSSIEEPDVPTAQASSGQRDRAAPRLKVRRVATGLDQSWDVQRLPTGELLVTERDTARLLVVRRHKVRELADLSDIVWASGEAGLMSIAVDPGFAENRRVFVCHGGSTPAGAHDVRISRLALAEDLSAVDDTELFLSGLPATSGRHSGCRLQVDRRTGALLVGTGDAAVGTNPQDLSSLGGKVLRMDRERANPWPDNPYVGSKDPNQRLLLTYGHRNVQGLAQRADGSWWSAEHGPDRNDEINRLVAGGNYGWNPVPGYNESVPMTDHSLPGKVFDARWRSGTPTLATSGAAWVQGKGWGRLDGTLAVAALKASRLVFMRFDGKGRFVRSWAPKALRRFGRLRSVTATPEGALLVTTANGSDDAVLRIRPKG